MNKYKILSGVLAVLFMTVLALYWRERLHNEFHRSKMLQYEYIRYLVYTSKRDIRNVIKAYPDIEKDGNGYFISAISAMDSEFLANKDFQPRDFMGVYLDVDENGRISHASLYKP